MADVAERKRKVGAQDGARPPLALDPVSPDDAIAVDTAMQLDVPPALPRRPLTAGQVRAIYDVMRTFRDDDLTRTDPEAEFLCARCGRTRPIAGSVLYGAERLCNGCATDYELLRTAGLERDLLTPEPDEKQA